LDLFVLCNFIYSKDEYKEDYLHQTINGNRMNVFRQHTLIIIILINNLKILPGFPPGFGEKWGV
jgi:hypothetical protein